MGVHLYWWPRSLSAVGGSPFLSRSRWSVSAPFCCLFDAFSLGILPSKLEDKSTITCDYTKQDKSQSLSQTWPPQCEHIYLGPPELEAHVHAEPGRGSNPTIICVSIAVIHAVPRATKHVPMLSQGHLIHMFGNKSQFRHQSIYTLSTKNEGQTFTWKVSWENSIYRVPDMNI